MQKRFGIILVSMSVLLPYQLVNAGAITDSYTPGDTLTATKMNTIKSAVNDNNNASRFYGDGSAGALTVSSSVSWSSAPPAGNNLNFTNIVINSGQTLSVPAGTTIRCTGTFTNNGTLTVNYGASANSSSWQSSGGIGPTVGWRTFPHPGDSFRAPAQGGFTNSGSTNPVLLYSGQGGIGIPKTTAASNFSHFRIGGGAGAGWYQGDGGGLVKIQCAGGIVNAGTINANGYVGSGATGGGGGGIVILASATSINNSAGTINANGGNGGNASSFGGNGGGGGGGIIIMVAPSLNTAGQTNSVAAGLGATGTGNVTYENRTAGGGGGASGGNGGSGGSVSAAATGVPSTASDGSVGYVLEIQANPANMM